MGYLPSKDADLLAFTANFATYLSANAVALGMLPANATAYASLQTSWAAALLAATQPNTRGKATIAAKAAVKKQIVALTRSYAQMIGRNVNVTNAQRLALGLNVRKQRTPIPPPATSPVIQILSVNAWTVKIKLKNADGTRRARPLGAIGASVFSYAGSAPPTSLSDWKFEGLCGKDVVDIVMDDSVPSGAKVWLTAMWFSERKETSPCCNPVSTIIQGGGVQSVNMPTLALAA